MSRIRTFALQSALLLALAAFAAAPALAWTPFAFTSSERYEFHVKRFEHSYWDDEEPQVSEYFYTLTVKETGAASPDGEPLFDVTTSYRRLLSESRLQESLSFGVFAFENMLVFGGPFELSFVLGALPDMEFEVGERMTILGLGRLSIVDEETLAGRTGLVVRLEVGESGNRRVAYDWTIDRALPLPLAVRQYDDEGRLTMETTLVEYEAL